MASGSGSRPRESTGTYEGERHLKRRRIDVDLETLDCPICVEPLTAPVYQCYEGHAVCGGCLQKFTKKSCPTCSGPIGRNRCIAIEKVIDSVLVPCMHAEYGCEKMLQYNCTQKRKEHEKECDFLPHVCPIGDCNYKVTKLSVLNHLADVHNFGRPANGGTEIVGSATTPIKASGLWNWVRTWVRL